MSSKDCYELIGTSLRAVRYVASAGKTEQERIQLENDFIKGKYEDVIRKKKNELELKFSNEDKDEINMQIREIKSAFDRIKSSELREIYNKEFDKAMMHQVQEGTRDKKDLTAYEVLYINKESLEYRTNRENDSVIEKKAQSMIKALEDELSAEKNLPNREKIKLKISRIKEAYEKINTEDKRSLYDKELIIIEEKRREEREKERIRKKYSHALEYDATLIRDAQISTGEIKKVIVRKEKENAVEKHLNDDQNRNLSIKNIAEIKYLAYMEGYIYEYEVKRIINGEEKIDTVYSIIPIFDLSINKNTGEKYNPEYYDCVANELLSEESIEGSKYNGGYIGMIKETKESGYDITLKDEFLVGQEQEMLTVCMILNEEKIKQEEKRKENEKREDEEWQK